LDQAFGFTPEQIHLTYWASPSKMMVSFASSDGTVTMGPPQHPPEPAYLAIVQFGLSAKRLTNNATCVTTTYVQDQFAFDKSPGYMSPYLSHCLMTGEGDGQIGGVWTRGECDANGSTTVAAALQAGNQGAHGVPEQIIQHCSHPPPSTVH